MRMHVPPVRCHPHCTQWYAATWMPASPPAAASTCRRRRRPVRPTAAPVLPPSTLHDHASHTCASCVSGPTTAYPRAPVLRRPPTAYQLSPCSDPTYGMSTSHTNVWGRATTHPKLTHASHLSRSHLWGLAAVKRLAAPPRVSLPHYASRCPTTRLVPPLRVSSSHYRLVPPLRMSAPHHPCCHPHHHPCRPPTMRLAASPAPTTHPVLLHTLLWPLSCVPALRFRRIQSHLRGVCRHCGAWQGAGATMCCA